jgi:spoIIIJ-associated protein
LEARIVQSTEQTGRTVEDAVKSALKILGVAREDVEVEVLSQESRGLLGILGYSEAKVRVTVVSSVAPTEPPAEVAPAPAPEKKVVPTPPAPRGEPTSLARRACEVLGQILSLMGVTARPELTREDEEAIYITIQGEEDLALLIGKQGQTLTSLQVITAMISNRPLPPEERKRIILDAADYRARRERSLISMARSAADRAKRTGREVPLQPLSPRERRIVHVTLADESGVTTRSEGEEPERFVVIVPARGGGGEGGGRRGRGPSRRRF